MKEKKQTYKGKAKGGKSVGYDIRAAVAARIAAREERERNGIYPAVFMRLSLTDDADAVTKGMTNAEFREFVSAAIRRAAKRR